MEDLKLKYREIVSYEPAEDLVLSHEESMETAIPEYCPDLARVVDASGQIRLRERSVSDGKLNLSGSVYVTVLYTSEESPGLRSLTVSLPLSCRTEDKRDCQVISVTGRLLLLEVKPLGARKLYIRALPEFRVSGYRAVVQRIAVHAEESPDLQVLYRKSTLPLLRDVWEQEFPVAQEAAPEEEYNSPEDLLTDRCCLRVTGCQRFGGKLVVKGEAILFLLCRDEEQGLRSRTLTLPFSQIIDREDLPEEGIYCCRAQALEYEAHPVRSERGSAFGVTLRIALLIRAYEQLPVEYVADLYSTRCDLAVERQELRLMTAQPPEELHRDSVQRLEGAGSFVYLTGVECGQPEIAAGSGEAPAVRSGIRLKILYLDESGTPVVAERTAEVGGEIGQIPSAVRAAAGPESWQRISNGFEVRVPVTFFLRRDGEETLNTVLSVRRLGEIDRAAMPSLILRRLREGETLWEVACQCHTEEQAILAANGLSEGDDPGDRLLLIPKMR